MTPARSASVRVSESVWALTAEDNLSTATRRTWRSSLCSPAHGAAAVIFDHVASGCFLRRMNRQRFWIVLLLGPEVPPPQKTTGDHDYSEP